MTAAGPSPEFFNLDIEPTNRCNASCDFCPRHATPHQGLMSPEVFDKTFERAVALRDLVVDRWGARMKANMCGLGEPLLNKHTPEWVARTVAAGFETSISSNGALLDETRGPALLEAGLSGVEINVGEVDDEYEAIYGLPFDKTRDNVARFAEMAGDDCRVSVVLVDHRDDADHMQRMVDFWTERGIRHFTPLSIMNRGGTLFVDHMEYETRPEIQRGRELLAEMPVEPLCGVPFFLPFVGYDGNYQLCCSDWTREATVGNVFDDSMIDVLSAKLGHVMSREPICRTCNHDPLNRVVDVLTAGADAEHTVEEVLESTREGSAVGETLLAEFGVEPPPQIASQRRRIPVRVTGP